MDKEKMARISALTQLARERELTSDEEQERATLRAQYIAEMKGSLRDTLNHTWVVDKKGNRKRLGPQEPEQ